MVLYILIIIGTEEGMNEFEMNYIISEERLKELLEEEARYIALENGGVDNWEWYGTSIQEYLSLCEVNSIFEIAKERMNEFETLD